MALQASSPGPQVQVERKQGVQGLQRVATGRDVYQAAGAARKGRQVHPFLQFGAGNGSQQECVSFAQQPEALLCAACAHKQAINASCGRPPHCPTGKAAACRRANTRSPLMPTCLGSGSARERRRCAMLAGQGSASASRSTSSLPTLPALPSPCAPAS